MNQAIKQAWHEARTNPVYTSLYIVGVTLTILFVMVIGMLLYIKIAPVYPEVNRNNTIYITRHRIDYRENGTTISGVGRGAYEKIYSKLKNCRGKALASKYSYEVAITSPTSSNTLNGQKKEVSNGFWDIYAFDFLAGQKLPDNIYEEENPTDVIITDKISERLFGSPEEAIGKRLKVSDLRSEKEYKVSGVVRSASYLSSGSYADLYVPMGRYMAGSQKSESDEMMGGYLFIATTSGPAQTELLIKEIDESLARFNNSPKADESEWTLSFQPKFHWKETLAPGDSSGSLTMIIWMLVIILLALVVVPAINLSGLIGGRMDTRLSELGIRKSYGATRGSLLRQVLFENFLLTSVGALLGMIGAWIVIKTCRRWIFSIFDPSPSAIPDWAVVDVNSDMMFAPMLFLILLVVCFAVNLLSAFFPAWAYMRKPIVSSLYEKR